MGVIRVLIADRDAAGRAELLAAVASNGRLEVVGETGDPAAVLPLTLQLQPDVVLLDMTMPMATGSQAISEIRAHLPATKVVLVAAVNDALVADAVRASGAHELVARGAAPSVLVNKLLELGASDHWGSRRPTTPTAG